MLDRDPPGHLRVLQPFPFSPRFIRRCPVCGRSPGGILPARLHDRNPVYDMAHCLPRGATLYGDKADNSGDDEAWREGEWGVHLVPIRTCKMTPNSEAEGKALGLQRAVIEGVNSQLAAWGVQRLHAHTHA